jgi:hypothetical protein
MDQHDRLALATLDIVKLHAINTEEPAHRRRLLFGSPGFLPIVQNSSAQCCGRACQNRASQRQRLG